MGQATQRYRRWSVEDLARLGSLCENYVGKRRGKNCGFHAFLAGEMGRTLEAIAHGIGIIHGHRERGRNLGYRKRVRLADVPPLELTEGQKCYLAAMFEGEGSLVRVEHNHWRFGFIYNTDYALVEYVKSLVPFANVHARNADETRRTQKLWAVATASRTGVLWAVRTLRPFCKGRKIAKMNQAEAELQR